MNEIQSIITERVDDIPLLLEQMQRMHLPALIDQHFPAHSNWQGLSLGWVTTIGLSSILSRGDHRLVHVEPWVGTRLWTLRTGTGQGVERLDFTDDRLEIVLRRLSDDTRWSELESALNQHTVRVYDLVTNGCDRTIPNALRSLLPGFNLRPLLVSHRHGLRRQVPVMDDLPNTTKPDHPKVQDDLSACDGP